jgi:hypothetical protein
MEPRPLTCILYRPRIIMHNDDDCGAVGVMLGKGIRSIQWVPTPVPLCPSQIPHDPTRARTGDTTNFLPYICHCCNIWTPTHNTIDRTHLFLRTSSVFSILTSCSRLHWWKAKLWTLVISYRGRLCDPTQSRTLTLYFAFINAIYCFMKRMKRYMHQKWNAAYLRQRVWQVLA